MVAVVLHIYAGIASQLLISRTEDATCHTGPSHICFGQCVRNLSSPLSPTFHRPPSLQDI